MPKLQSSAHSKICEHPTVVSTTIITPVVKSLVVKVWQANEKHWKNNPFSQFLRLEMEWEGEGKQMDKFSTCTLFTSLLQGIMHKTTLWRQASKVSSLSPKYKPMLCALCHYQSWTLKGRQGKNLLSLLTWGTHLGDTKLVASMTERPVSDSILIKSIFTSVGTMFYEGNRKRKHSLLPKVLSITVFSLPFNLKLDGTQVYFSQDKALPYICRKTHIWMHKILATVIECA